MLVSLELILLLLTIFLLIFFYFIAKKDNTFLDKYTKKFPIIGAIFVPIGIYLTYKVFKQQHETMVRDATFKIIDRAWIKINEDFLKYYKDCPNFIDSLFFKWQKKTLGFNNSSNSLEIKDKWYAVNYISNIIFQSWEDFITASQTDETGYQVWICIFLQWCQSKQLYENWKIIKASYATTTNELGDYLFEYVKTHTINNTDELFSAGNYIVNSSEFKNIIARRFSH
jgi:hypothetical protein